MIHSSKFNCLIFCCRIRVLDSHRDILWPVWVLPKTAIRPSHLQTASYRYKIYVLRDSQDSYREAIIQKVSLVWSFPVSQIMMFLALDFTCLDIFDKYPWLFSAMDAGFLHPNGTNYFFTDGQIHKLGNDRDLIALCAA